MSEARRRTLADTWNALKPAARGMRHQPTPAESALWLGLRRRQLAGWKFRRQHPIGPFLVDFACLEARLVVELDGEIHAHQQTRDQQRTEYLEDAGFRVLRFDNQDVFDDMGGVIARIRAHLDEA